jgi:hypothetical protein
MNISGKIHFFYFFFFISYYVNAQTVAPDFTLTDTHGVTRNLYSELNAGKSIVLDFFITNCGTCQINTAVLESIWQTYGYDGDSIWVWSIEAIGATDSAINAFDIQYGATYPSFSTAFDDNVIVGYNITYTPQYFVVCPAGFIKQVPIESIAQNLVDCPEDNQIFENQYKTKEKWFYIDNSEIHFKITSNSFPVKVNVYSSIGKIVNAMVINDNSGVFNISDLEPDVYFIVVYCKDGKSLTGKFLKYFFP